MRLRFLSSLCACLLALASVGCPGASPRGEDSCANVGSRVEAVVDELPRDCTADADCSVRRFYPCSCPSPYRDPGDTELDSLLEEQNECADYGCNNEPYCPWVSDRDVYLSVGAACMGGRCRLVPRPSCDDIQTRPIGWADSVSCQDDDDCVVLTDTNPCGCPEAVDASEADAVAKGLSIAACDFTTECAALDCPVGTSAVCDQGICTLVP